MDVKTIVGSLFARLIVSLLFSLGLSVSVQATHIVGGELNYRYLGNQSYEIKLTVYRDCLNGQAPFDDPAAIGIYSSNGALFQSFPIPITDQSLMPSVVNSPCLIAPTNLCYELAHYVFTVTLPYSPGGYSIVYQRCCRNQTIVNLFNVANSGGTYLATIPDTSLAAANSNPVFNSLPPTFICTDEPFVFDHSASDADGDSLVYELCAPLVGGSRQDPAPDPPAPPPYSTVVFDPPYSLNNMMGGVPFTVDRFTGQVTATPLTQGQFVYGLCVKEYRNGIYLGESRRDFQLNVVPCPKLTIASIFSPTIVCGSLTATFINTSAGAGSYYWDFGIPGVTSDTSSQFQPSYTYPDTGTYPIYLIAYSAQNPLCNDTTPGQARIYPPFLADMGLSNQRCSPEFRFQDRCISVNGPTNYWRWTFGDGTFSSSANPIHTYGSPGTYPVTFIASADSGCTDTVTQMVNVLRLPEPDFNLIIDTCSFLVQTVNQTMFASTYQWRSDGILTDTAFQTDINIDAPGNHAVSLTAVSDSGCSVTDTRTFVLPELPDSRFTWQVTPCDSTVRFGNSSAFASSYRWDFGDSTISSDVAPTHTYTIAGRVPVKLISISPFGCQDTMVDSIFFVSYKAAYFDARQDSCSRLVSFEQVTENAVVYRWDFGDGTNSFLKNPLHAWAKDGTYRITLTVNGEYACIDSTTRTIDYESPKGERVYLPNAFTPNGDGVNDVFSASLYNPCETYDIVIYNRWGEKIWSSDLRELSWDGTFSGLASPSGIYVYQISSGDTRRTGTVALIR